jgi:hypothetical protein
VQGARRVAQRSSCGARRAWGCVGLLATAGGLV